jgi:hypothetical protein
LSPSYNEKVSYTRLKNNGEILRDTFLFYARYFNKVIPWILVAALAATMAKFFLEEPETIVFAPTEFSEWIVIVFANMLFALKTPSAWFILINGICFAAVAYRTMKILDADAKKTTLGFDFVSLLQLTILSAAMFGLIFLDGWGVFILFLVFGILMIISFTQLSEGCNLVYAIGKAWELVTSHIRQAFGMQLILLMLTFSFLALLSAPLLYFYTDILRWSFGEDDALARSILQFIESFLKTCSFYMILPILAASTGYLYYALEEIHSATNLKESIAKMGLRTSKTAKR